MAKTIPNTQAELCELLDYNPQTGRLFWKTRNSSWFIDTPKRSVSHMAALWNANFAGKEAFTSTNTKGYKQSKLLGYEPVAHRIIWLMLTGEQPEQIDHINGDRSDNRFQNLRAVTQSENQRNAKLRKDNSSGITGVYYRKKQGNWYVEISGRHLGCFSTKEEAVSARKDAERREGYHPNHGKARC